MVGSGPEDAPSLARPCVEALRLAATLMRQDPRGVGEQLRQLSPLDIVALNRLAHDLLGALKQLPPEARVSPCSAWPACANPYTEPDATAMAHT
jgi:hypothetical protein